MLAGGFWRSAKSDIARTVRFLRLCLLAVAAGFLCTAPACAQQNPAPSAVETTAIPGFAHAQIYRQPGEVRRPVVVIMAGAEGGDDAGRRFGPILARLGYAAVSLPYYSPNWGDKAPPPSMPDLPGSLVDIPIDQLARLRQTLAGLPGVDVTRFGIFTGSKGSEFALIAASRYSWITAVVAYAPSDLVWEGWGLETVGAPATRSSFSFGGKPLAFMPYRDFFSAAAVGSTEDLRTVHENGRADHPEREAAARIPIETYSGALMLVAGERDRLWNSARMSRNVVATRTRAGLSTEALIYPEAGHDLAGGSAELREDPRGGGSPEANAQARADSWPKVLAFMAKTLRP